MLTLSSRRASVRRPKQHWSCSKTVSSCPQEKTTTKETLTNTVKRASYKIFNSKNYGRMPEAGVDMTNAHWLKIVARLERV